MLDLTETPLGYPVFVLCHRDLVTLGLQDWPLHVLQQIIDGVDVGVGQLIGIVLGLGGCGVGQQVSFPSSSTPG